MLVASSGKRRLLDTFFDDTFAGIHQLSWFDWALLIPYFAILIILSLYGMHRYETLRTYYRHRKKLPKEPWVRFEKFPRVTVQLPLYNERFVVQRLIEAATKLEYPRELLQIQVLDDSTDETQELARQLVEDYRGQGFPIEYHHRSHREGFKAGALQEGLEKATGEFVAVFDADFIPPPGFLLSTVHYFADPQVGVVQTRWAHLNRHYSVLTEVHAMLLDAHFVLEHGARCGRGLFFNFNGTAGILRRRMIEDAGGWQHDTLTEDSDLSYRAQLNGWRFVYVSSVECPAELPDEMYGFHVQQSRWAKGLTQVSRKLLGRILKAPIPLRTKLEAFMHLTPNISYPLMVVFSALMLPVMIVRFYMGWFQMVVLDLPLIIATFWSLSVFYVAAQRELFPHNWKKSVFLLPALISVGIGLTVINTRAVIEAFLGVQTGFARTAKYALGDQKVKVARARYRRKSGWLPFIELGIGTYFIAVIAYAIETYNFLVIPFLLLFVAGYYWAALATLHQEWKGRLLWQRERAVGIEVGAAR